MRILFLNYTFPGPLGTMAASLAALPGNEVLFASEYGRRDFSLPGVKRVLLKKPKDRKKAAVSISTPALDAGERDWTMAYLRGRATASSLMGVLAEGFEPDMVILSGSMGNGLFVRNLFPEAFLVGYADWYFRDEAETRYPLSTMPDIPLAPAISATRCKRKTFLIVTAILRRRNGNGSNTPKGCAGSFPYCGSVWTRSFSLRTPPADSVSGTVN